jgi:hypothetical protein
MHKPSLNLHRNNFGFVAYVLTGVVLLCTFFTAAAQVSTTVQVVPQNLSIRYGEKAQFSVEILDAQNMYGFELHIAYDPTKLQVVDGDPNVAGIQLLPGDLYEIGQGFLVASDADNETGKALFAFTLLAPAAPMEGNGSLIIIEVEAIGGGVSAIELEEVILASPEGEALPFAAIDGEVVVEGAPESTSISPAISAEPSTIESETRTTPTISITGDPPANQLTQYLLLGFIIVMVLIMVVALFLILRWGFRRR